jgi:hypothetical protein
MMDIHQKSGIRGYVVCNDAWGSAFVTDEQILTVFQTFKGYLSTKARDIIKNVSQLTIFHTQ